MSSGSEDEDAPCFADRTEPVPPMPRSLLGGSLLQENVGAVGHSLRFDAAHLARAFPHRRAKPKGSGLIAGVMLYFDS